MKKITIGIVGFGTVGTGVLKILRNNKKFITNRLGTSIEVKKIVDLDIKSDRGLRLRKGLLSKNVNDLINDPSEKYDLAASMPDLVSNMKEALLEWEASCKASDQGGDYQAGVQRSDGMNEH